MRYYLRCECCGMTWCCGGTHDDDTNATEVDEPNCPKCDCDDSVVVKVEYVNPEGDYLELDP